jgi:asparagine synthase (glutamine-hydrolysing)
VFCQDTLRCETINEQPFFDPVRVRDLMDRVAALHPAERAGLESVILRIVSTCLLQQRFGLGSG